MKRKTEIIQWMGRILSIVSIGFIVCAVCRLGLDFSFVNNVPLFILVMGIGLILSLAVIHRLITVIGDFLGYLIVMLSAGKEEKKAEA